MSQTFQELANQVAAVKIAPAQAKIPHIKVNLPVKTDGNVPCNENSLQLFHGNTEDIRFLAACGVLHDQELPGSSRQYQAVVIIRRKTKGPTDAVLSSFGTVLNFDAIINRLDFTYNDKPLEESLTLLQYYEEVGKKLTLPTYKASMSYDASAATVLCETFRADALRVFVSGLRGNCTDVQITTKLKDMASALALPQQVESNHEQYTFATSFARSQEDSQQREYS